MEDEVHNYHEASASNREQNQQIIEESDVDSDHEKVQCRPCSVGRNTHTDFKRKNARSLNESCIDDDGTSCPICLDAWTTSGDHRLVALRCGHLFGLKCVKRWLYQRDGGKKCPTCKEPSSTNDIQQIYARKVVALDNFEVEVVKRKLEAALVERNKAQADLAKALCQEAFLQQQVQMLRAQINAHNYNGNKDTVESSIHGVQRSFKWMLDKSMEVCKSGQSRVFDFNNRDDILLVSIKSPSNLFGGYGIKKISCANYKTTAFIPIHSLQIRDVKVHIENDMTLTVSMDKWSKVMDNRSHSITHQMCHDIPLWSCCWDHGNPYHFYVGTQSGEIFKYDVRSIDKPVTSFIVDGDMSPVVSVASIPPPTSHASHHVGGVLSCKLNSLWLFEDSSGDINTDIEQTQRPHLRHSLVLEGPFISMKYDRGRLLVSSRPNSRTTYSRHTLCNLERHADITQSPTVNVLHTFQGGGMQKLLTKSCFFSCQSDINEWPQLVAAYHENTKSVYLWSVDTGDKVCSIPARNTVIDLKGVRNCQGSNFLVSLTESRLEFFKFL